MWSLCNPIRVDLCEWGHVLCHFKQNQGNYPVKDAQAWSDWGRVHSESWVLQSDCNMWVGYCVSVVCFAGIVWKAVNFFCFLCFSCCWPTKDENDYSGWFLLSGKEPNLMKMSPRQPSAYYFSILDVLYGCPGKINEIKCVILTFNSVKFWISPIVLNLQGFWEFCNAIFSPSRWQHLFDPEGLCMHFLWGKTSNGFNKQIFFLSQISWISCNSVKCFNDFSLTARWFSLNRVNWCISISAM